MNQGKNNGQTYKAKGLSRKVRRVPEILRVYQGWRSDPHWSVLYPPPAPCVVAALVFALAMEMEAGPMAVVMRMVADRDISR